MIEERPDGRVTLAARAAAAPVLLAATTLAAVASAVLALFPAVLRGRPAGRPAPRSVEVLLTSPPRPPSSEAAAEPLGR